MSRSYILNFTISRELSEVEYYFDFEGQRTNIDFLLDDFSAGMTNWAVPQKAALGDVAFFMCARSARNNLGMATSHLSTEYGPEFRQFVEKEKALYKKYSGYLLGCGVVASTPEYDEGLGWWTADVNELRQFDEPVNLDDFKSFIAINSWSSVTILSDEQKNRLMWVISQKNPGFFENAIPPTVETLDAEFKASEKKKAQKTLEQLEKEAKKKASKPELSTVQTKYYHRDPSIAAYVKKRADGRCELCGADAPFRDANGDPYLECHHIIWLSEGGIDSADNCVALCPNCHRRMHILKDQQDIASLQAIVR